MDKRTKKELIAEIESLKKEVKHLKEIRQRDYNLLLTKYNEAETSLKSCSYSVRKRIITAYREGLLNGLVALDDNLKSTVMKVEWTEPGIVCKGIKGGNKNV